MSADLESRLAHHLEALSQGAPPARVEDVALARHGAARLNRRAAVARTAVGVVGAALSALLVSMLVQGPGTTGRAVSPIADAPRPTGTPTASGPSIYLPPPQPGAFATPGSEPTPRCGALDFTGIEDEVRSDPSSTLSADEVRQLTDDVPSHSTVLIAATVTRADLSATGLLRNGMFPVTDADTRYSVIVRQITRASGYLFAGPFGDPRDDGWYITTYDLRGTPLLTEAVRKDSTCFTI